MTIIDCYELIAHSSHYVGYVVSVA